MTVANRSLERLSALEIAHGSPLEPLRPIHRAWSGAGRTAHPITDDTSIRRLADAAYQALVDAIRPALVDTSCLISFSGGMDSSFVLAVAAECAARDGLPAPVPIVLRFTNAPEADETARQHQVLQALRGHGRCGEPIVLTVDDELDFAGSVARRMLDLIGPQVPTNIYSHLPMLDVAAGGTLLTGFGGDQLVGGHGRQLSRRTRVVAALPLRLEATLRRADDDLPWLRPDVAGECRRLRTARRRWRLLSARDRIVREAGSRLSTFARTGLDQLAHSCGARIAHPLFDAVFLARLADLLDVLPPIRRAPLYRLIAGDRLPAPVTAWHPKAVLRQVFDGPATAAAARSFDPDGLRPDVRDLLDVDGLMAMWRSRGPVLAAGLLLHVAMADAAQPISPLSPPSPPAGAGAG